MLSYQSINDWLHSGVVMSSGEGNVLMGWGNRSRSPLPDASLPLPQFYFPGYFLDDQSPWFTFSHHVEVSINALSEALQIHASSTANVPSWITPEPDQFNRAFDELQRLFADQTLKKAVPYNFQTTTTRMSRQQLVASLRKLLSYISSRPAYAYGLWDQTGGILGATPEYLFRYRNGKELQTMACAGTAQPGRSLEEFMNDPKERHEHNLVIDDIALSLSPYGSVSKGQTAPVPFGRLHHLVTPIRLSLAKPFDFEGIVRTLHPTAALGAFPRKAGLEWLRHYDIVVERGRFGAPAGYLHIGNGDAACYVAIRNVQWNPDGMRIGAGCGIVPESRCAYEWNEIMGKLQAIREVLAL